MKIFEPTRVWQNQQHQRVRNQDPTAFSELCELALTHLVDFLYNCFPQSDIHLRTTAAIDCLLDYQTHPDRYDPDRLPLFSYLRMAVRRDMLNAIDKQRRHESHFASLEDPTVTLYLDEQGSNDPQNDLDDWLQEHTTLSLNEILTSLDAKLDDLEKEILFLMLEGTRESSAYYKILGVSHMETDKARKIVKMAKDRVMKKIQRFGDSISLK